MGLDDELDLVAISCFTPSATRAMELADAFRARGRRVVMGGIFPTAMPDEAGAHADAVVVGEGEGAWLEVLRDAIRRAVEHGIDPYTSFLVGNDDDDEGVFDRMLAFTDDAGVRKAEFAIFTPYPATPVWHRMVAEGRILHRDWSRYNDANVVFRPAKMSPERLLEGLPAAVAGVLSRVRRCATRTTPRAPCSSESPRGDAAASMRGIDRARRYVAKSCILFGHPRT